MSFGDWRKDKEERLRGMGGSFNERATEGDKREATIAGSMGRRLVVLVGDQGARRRRALLLKCSCMVLKRVLFLRL
jgi:hypothetical protein